ncbi:MAG: molybdate ABC transporter permease subunit, partial [Cyanobacteria bacterium P01_D01_bin.128]
MPDDLTPLWISLKTAIASTLLAAGLGILAARWMLSYRGKRSGYGLIDGLLTLPLVLPPTVVGFLLLVLLGKHSPLGQILDRLGVSVIFTWAAVVIAATVVAFPLMYKTVLGAFEQVDPTLLNSARTLGASERRIFWQILLPLAGPGVLAGTVLAFARALGEFGATLMVGGSIPGVTQTMPIAIFFAAEAGRMGVALTWVLLMMGISLVGITAINTLNQPNRPRPIRDRPIRDRLPSPLLSRFHLPIRRSVSEIFPPTPHSPSLSVTLIKHLPGYTLNLSFSTDRRPLGLLGASGAGKSLILRCIAGTETPDAGRIVLNGRVLFDSERGINLPSRDRRVGILFQ